MGSLEVSRLKVVGESVCSIGEVADIHHRPRLGVSSFQNKKSKLYRKIVTHKGTLIGVLAYGDWGETRRAQEAFQNQRRIWPWQKAWFWLTGNIYFNSGGGPSVKKWPSDTIVCQCNNVTQGALVQAIDEGASQLKSLQESTRAGTVCGSCKPLLEELVDHSGPRDKEPAWLPTAALSLLALLLVGCFVLLPSPAPSDSVQTIGLWESIWADKFYKQVTGFSLLGMSTLGLLISLRKSLRTKKLGPFSYWRVFHITLGVVCAATLYLHTGMRLGENFNQVLMLDFLAVLIIGALAGFVISCSHKLSASAANKTQKFWKWAHILVTWPLPALLGIHILTVYYY